MLQIDKIILEQRHLSQHHTRTTTSSINTATCRECVIDLAITIKMASTTSLFVLPTTHSKPHRFDYLLPKPSSLFRPCTSSTLETSVTFLDSPDKGSIKYSIESLHTIRQDAAIMTDRTRVLASQRAEHRKNLANYTKQRAARKSQPQQKVEEVPATAAVASTSQLNVSGLNLDDQPSPHDHFYL